MEIRKPNSPGPDTRTEDPKASSRPVGMQTMGPTIYEQIRRAVAELELKLVSDS